MGLHGTEVQVGDGELVAQMTRMREWLDSRRFEPAVFRYDHVDSAVIIRVDFAVEQEAVAFAREFRGKLLPQRATRGLIPPKPLRVPV